MFLLVCFATFWVLSGTIATAQESQTNDTKRANEIITEYISNQASIDRYCVLMKIESVEISHDDASKSVDGTIWQTAAFDAQSKSKRYDNITVVQNQDGLPVPKVASFFYVKNRAVSRNERRLKDNFDTDSSDITDSKFDHYAWRIEPWELPIATVSQFTGYTPVIDSRWTYRDMLSLNNLTELKEDPFSVTAEFLVDRKNSVSMRIVFDKKCHNLPVDCRVVLKREGAKELFLSICQTKWVKTVEGERFLPSSINFSSVVGNPEKPSLTRNYALELFWVLGAKLPENTFEFSDENFITAAQLQVEVMENQTKVAPLKSTLRR